MKWFETNLRVNNNNLKSEPYDYLKDHHGLSLRDYQIDAIEAVENKIISDPEDQRALIAMATGTGKTRTIIGLCYRLIKSKRFKRILFLGKHHLVTVFVLDHDLDGTTNNVIKNIRQITGMDDHSFWRYCAHPAKAQELVYSRNIAQFFRRIFHLLLPGSPHQ